VLTTFLEREPAYLERLSLYTQDDNTVSTSAIRRVVEEGGRAAHAPARRRTPTRR
jgi:hypothetical protein